MSDYSRTHDELVAAGFTPEFDPNWPDIPTFSEYQVSRCIASLRAQLTAANEARERAERLADALQQSGTHQCERADAAERKVAELEAELDRIERLSDCASVDSFMALPDEDNK